MALVKQWSDFNKLTINFMKSDFMVFGSQTALRKVSLPDKLSFSNCNLPRVEHFIYLGVKLDPFLSFEPAANELISKVSHKIYTLSVLRKDITISCAILLYKTMVLPYIDYINYCLHVCTDKIKTKIQRLQNRALRICLKATRYDRTVDLHGAAKLATVEKRRMVDTLKLFHHLVYRCIDKP